MNIYVGNLNYRVKEGDLQQVMEDYGAVSSVKVVMDRETGRSKGFAFIEMEDDAAAAKVTDKKAMLEAMDNYRNTYPVIKEYRMIRKEKDKQKFYAAHEADFIINDAAKRQLDKLGAPKQLPKRKEVVAEIQSLISLKNECYNDYREKSDRLHELMTMQRNYQMAMPQPKRGRSHEQER